jgi:hypothetical protein
VIAIAAFSFGIRVGTRLTVDNTLEIVFKALDNSTSLTNAQRIEIAKKMQEIAKKL